MTQARRIERAQDCPFTRGEQIAIQFEGRSITAYEREPLAMALLAAGVRVFGRSIKYHRPRGPTCLQGHCSGCLMRVDGQPNVRSCDTPSHSGLVVERQLGWPGSGRDLFRVMDWVYGERLDHHAMFTASGAVNRMAMGFVRKMAGFGHPPTADVPPVKPLCRMEAETVVIGAGSAGLQASMALAEAGHPVVLFEHSGKIGGRLLDRSCRVAPQGQEPQSGWAARAALRERFEQLCDIELHQHTPVVAVYPGRDRLQVVARGRSETLAVDAQRLVISCGDWGQVPLFEDNDLPGIFALRALDRLVFGWGVVPAEPVLVGGDSDQALALAEQLKTSGVAVAGLVTERPADEALARLEERDIEIHRGRIVRARGGRWLDRVELAPGGGDSRQADRVLDCGLLAIDAPGAPAYELAHHAGCRVAFHSDNGYAVTTDARGRTSDRRVFAAGHCCGAAGVGQAWRQGLRAGLACALSLDEDKEVAARLEALIDADAAAR